MSMASTRALDFLSLFSLNCPDLKLWASAMASASFCGSLKAAISVVSNENKGVFRSSGENTSAMTRAG